VLPSAKPKRKPPSAGIGRKKGVPNKITVAFKQAVLEAFNDERMGGSDGLVEWGLKNRTEFYRIAARLIPTEGTGGIEHTHRVYGWLE
jgi:hypothetical protein